MVTETRSAPQLDGLREEIREPLRLSGRAASGGPGGQPQERQCRRQQPDAGLRAQDQRHQHGRAAGRLRYPGAECRRSAGGAAEPVQDLAAPADDGVLHRAVLRRVRGGVPRLSTGPSRRSSARTRSPPCSSRRQNVRLQCERELKAMLVRLRQGYIAAAGDQRMVRDILISTAKGLTPLLRAMLWIDGCRPAEDHGFDPAQSGRRVRRRSGRRPWPSTTGGTRSRD